jgi:hypothetical protein
LRTSIEKPLANNSVSILITQDDIKSLTKWNHVAISEDATDFTGSGFNDSVLSQVLLGFRERSENVISFLMYHGSE